MFVMSIYSTLSSEHEKILHYLDRIEDCGSDTSEKRTELFTALKHLVLMDMDAEKRSLYPHLKHNVHTRDLANIAEQEKDQIKDSLEYLSGTDLSGALWMRKFMHLKEDLEYHIRHEEHELYPTAKSVINDTTAEEIDKNFRRHVDKT